MGTDLELAAIASQQLLALDLPNFKDLRPHKTACYWLQADKQTRGRYQIMRYQAGQLEPLPLPPAFEPRAKVNEYGGGALAIADHGIYFVNKACGQVYRYQPGTPSRLTHSDARFADLLPVAEGLVAVAEHPVAGQSLVFIAKTDGQVVTLHCGQDFYAAPTVDPKSQQIAWITWRHPNMPWEQTCVWQADWQPQRLQAKLLRNKPHVSNLEPKWGPDGTLWVLSDELGYWQLYQLREDWQCVDNAPCDQTMPLWNLGQSHWAPLPQGQAVCHISQGGGQLGIVQAGQWQPVPVAGSMVQAVQPWQEGVVWIQSYADRGTQIWWRAPEGQCEPLTPSVTSIPLSMVTTPQSLVIPTPAGELQAWFYAPTTALQAPTPLIVKCHSGPTALSTACLEPRLQFWTQLGFAVLDVNYRGSAGFGRKFRERLNGQWGVAEVADCIQATKWVLAEYALDSRRVMVRGSSAGGFTALCALIQSDIFCMGASYYGVTCLQTLASVTHAFEKHTLETLIGPNPTTSPLYPARSPLAQAHKLKRPVIFFHGDADPVVPKSQALALYESLKQQGIPSEWHCYPDCGHGFGDPAIIAQSLQAEWAFYHMGRKTPLFTEGM